MIKSDFIPILEEKYEVSVTFNLRAPVGLIKLINNIHIDVK